jgi:hypothetical protein
MRFQCHGVFFQSALAGEFFKSARRFPAVRVFSTVSRTAILAVPDGFSRSPELADLTQESGIRCSLSLAMKIRITAEFRFPILGQAHQHLKHEDIDVLAMVRRVRCGVGERPGFQ